MKYVDAGNGKMPLISLIAILSISLTVNLPGLAISPIMGKLDQVFHHVTELEIQLLTVLPNLVTIPFILCSGKICKKDNQMLILAVGLGIYTLTGVLYFFADTMIELILLSCLLGVGCGLVIPLAASLVSQYFSGQARTRQLGMKSSISNFTVIFATLFVGWIASIAWHLAFIVYMVPIIPLCLIPFMTDKYIGKHRLLTAPAPTTQHDDETEAAQTFASNAKPSVKVHTLPPKTSNVWIAFPGKTAIRMLFCLMGLYLAMTYGTEVVSYYLPFVMEHYDLTTGDVGVATAMFFAAATLSGFLLTHIISIFKKKTMQCAIVLCVVGLFMMGFLHGYWSYILGVFIMGFGYGVIQPVIYDKTSYVAPTAAQSTEYFAYLLTCNYIGISIVPFIVGGAKKLFGAEADPNFSFIFNGGVVAVVLILAIWKYRSFVFEADPEYYKQLNPPIPGYAPASEQTPAVSPQVKAQISDLKEEISDLKDEIDTLRENEGKVKIDPSEPPE
ncbi:MAG: MFS transporter [Muribaculaceae bacterium]|nr:MFS transporter [Muribaculaceae bacterium]